MSQENSNFCANCKICRDKCICDNSKMEKDDDENGNGSTNKESVKQLSVEEESKNSTFKKQKITTESSYQFICYTLCMFDRKGAIDLLDYR